MRRSSLSLLAILVGLLPSLAGSEPVLEDLHLSAAPRTDAETARIKAVTNPTQDFSAPEMFEANPGGAGTVKPARPSTAFDQMSATLKGDKSLDFRLGEALFDKLWVSSPSSTQASDGLGPLYNARSCQRCHVRGGRGHPPESTEDRSVSFLLRLGSPPQSGTDAPGTSPRGHADPTYGTQLQTFSVAGLAAEGVPRVTYTEEKILLSGGETATLRRPTYSIENLGYRPLDAGTLLSPRIAPQMIGMGLLGAIPARDILALSDPNDDNGDGISGRAQIVTSSVFGAPMLGRFGHKAGHATVLEQTAAAFAQDIGISTPLFPSGYGDCTVRQAACRTAPNGNTVHHDNAEISDVGLDLTTLYAANLAIPTRRGLGTPEVLRGKQVFYETGCTSCHRPKFVTHRLTDRPEHSFQLIWPYSDLLLHDMGAGLADGLPDHRATGREWRTSPLWGIGRTRDVSGHMFLLHDGRARSLLEAVLWHGGEATQQTQAVIDMPPENRRALIRFLESL